MPFQTTFCSRVRRSRHLVQPAEQRGEAQLCSSPAVGQDPGTPAAHPAPLTVSAVELWPVAPCAPCPCCPAFTCLGAGLVARPALSGRGGPMASPTTAPPQPLTLPTPLLPPNPADPAHDEQVRREASLQAARRSVGRDALVHVACL